MTGSSSEGAGMVGLVIRLIFSLGLVLGLLLLIARVANRRFQGRAGAPIQVIARQQLSRSSSVAVVTVGTRVLVLGTTEQSITLLTEVEPDEVGIDPDSLDESLTASETPATQAKAGTVSALGGSILSPQTWRQTWDLVRGAKSGTPQPPTEVGIRTDEVA